jgi:hypothetical protein
VEAVFAIADEITGEDYRTEEGLPLVDRKIAAIAHVAQFVAAIDACDLNDDNRQNREEWLQKANSACSTMVLLDCPKADVEVARAMLSARQSYQRHLIAAACDTLRTTPVSTDVAGTSAFRIARSLAIAFESLSDNQCVTIWSELLASRQQLDEKDRQPMTVFLYQSLARTLAAFGGSTSDFEALSQVRISRFRAPLQIKLIRALAVLFEACMRCEWATQFIEQAPQFDDPQLALIQIRGTSRTDPDRAIQRLVDFRNRYRDPEDDGARATSLLLQSWSAARLADIHGYVAAIEDAIGLFLRANHSAQATYCQNMYAAFWLRHHGNFERARRALDEYARSVHSATANDDPQALHDNVIRFEIDLRSNLGSSAPMDEYIHASLLEEAERSSKPHNRIEAALALFAHLTPGSLSESAARIASLLIDSFERMPDALARANYPWLLRDVRHQVTLDSKLVDWIEALIVIREPTSELLGQKTTDTDRAWASLAHAHLLRFIGRSNAARPMVEFAENCFRRLRSLTGLREVWHLNASCGWRRHRPDELQPFHGKAETLQMFIAVEQAEHAVLSKDFARANDWMTHIDIQPIFELPTNFAPRAKIILAELAQVGVRHDSAVDLFQNARKAFESLGDQRSAYACNQAIQSLSPASDHNASLELAPRRSLGVYPAHIVSLPTHGKLLKATTHDSWKQSVLDFCKDVLRRGATASGSVSTKDRSNRLNVNYQWSIQTRTLTC